MNRFLFLMIFIIVVVGGWSGAWIYAAQRLDSEAATYFASTQNTELQIECEQFSVAGFPFRFDITCSNLSINGPDLSIKIPRVQVAILVYRPTHALVFATGPAQIQDSFSGSRRQINWTDFSASVRTSGWALTRISLEASNVELVDNLIGQTLIARTEQINMHLIDDPAAYDEVKNLATLGAFATFSAIEVPEFSISNASIAAQASISSMPDDLRLWSLANLSRNWFENQSGIELLKFEGEDKSSNFSIIGNLTTTAQSMPNGNFDFNSTNLAERFNTILDQAGIEVVFGQQSDDGSRYQSYSVRHGVILAANLPLLTLAPLR